MSDYISRQAAIDAFGLSEKTRKYGGDHSGYGTMMLYEIQDTLESLSPAQRWIPCSEMLPEESGDYLVTVAHHSGELLVEVDQFDNENGSWWHYMDDVIAWMPLPEPYKGEES